MNLVSYTNTQRAYRNLPQDKTKRRTNAVRKDQILRNKWTLLYSYIAVYNQKGMPWKLGCLSRGRLRQLIIRYRTPCRFLGQEWGDECEWDVGLAESGVMSVWVIMILWLTETIWLPKDLVDIQVFYNFSSVTIKDICWWSIFQINNYAETH